MTDENKLKLPLLNKHEYRLILACLDSAVTDAQKIKEVDLVQKLSDLIYKIASLTTID